MMSIRQRSTGKYVLENVPAGAYKEKKQVELTGRLLDGSSGDYGYWKEYVGYGHVEKIPVRVVYLHDEDQQDIIEECHYDWAKALRNGRIEIDMDELSEDARSILDYTVGAGQAGRK